MKLRAVPLMLFAAISLAIGAGRMAGAATPAPGDTMSKEEADGIIFERQQIMLQLERDTDTLGMIASGLAPKDKLAATTRSIANAARDSMASFKTWVPGGRSKPEVWTNGADFTARMEKFVENTERLAKVGETGNVNAVNEIIVEALPCKQCHDLYREPKR